VESEMVDLSEYGATDNKKMSKKTLTEAIMRPRLNEIFAMVRIELDRAGILNRIPAGIIITGGGAETVGIVDSAKNVLKLPVRIGKPKGVSGLIDDIINPAFSVPVGLLIYGAKREPNSKMGFLSKGFKFPNVGFASKIIDTIKNLLP
jgi:cell division protein FtsA